MPDIKIAIGPDEDRYLRWFRDNMIRIEGEYGHDEATVEFDIDELLKALCVVKAYMMAMTPKDDENA